jgi:hypothetical protein
MSKCHSINSWRANGFPDGFPDGWDCTRLESRLKHSQNLAHDLGEPPHHSAKIQARQAGQDCLPWQGLMNGQHWVNAVQSGSARVRITRPTWPSVIDYTHDQRAHGQQAQPQAKCDIQHAGSEIICPKSVKKPDEPFPKLTHFLFSLSLSFSPSLSLSLSLSLSVAFYSLFSFAIPFATFLFIFAAPCDRGSLARNFRRLVDLRVFLSQSFRKNNSSRNLPQSVRDCSLGFRFHILLLNPSNFHLGSLEAAQVSTETIFRTKLIKINAESRPEPGLIYRYPCTADMYSTTWAADESDARIEDQQSRIH